MSNNISEISSNWSSEWKTHINKLKHGLIQPIVIRTGRENGITKYSYVLLQLMEYL